MTASTKITPNGHNSQHPPTMPLSPKNLILIAVMACLLGSVFLHSNSGFVDHDEFAHYVSLKSMNKQLWFSPWQRAGFKVLYLPFQQLDLSVIRGLNLILLLLCCYLLYRIQDLFLPLVFLTFPLNLWFT